MPETTTTLGTLEVPAGWQEEFSTRLFTGPTSPSFRPNLLVQAQKAPPDPADAKALALNSMAEMVGNLPGFTVLSDDVPELRGKNRHGVEYSWLDRQKNSLHQIQAFLVEGNRMYILTGTLFKGTEADYRLQLIRSILSFRP